MCNGLGVNEEKSRVEVEIPRTGIKGRQSFLGLFYLFLFSFQNLKCLFYLLDSSFQVFACLLYLFLFSFQNLKCLLYRLLFLVSKFCIFVLYFLVSFQYLKGLF